MKCLFKSFLAGIMIGIGGSVFLSIASKYLGASLFAIGLLFIVVYGFNLYTGKVGYLVSNFNIKYIRDLIIIIIGNFLGTFFVGFILKFTRIYDSISAKAGNMVDIKLGDSPISILILAFFCGILMYLAVNSYKTLKDVGKYLAVFICVIVFILCSFEHSIANMFYISVADMWSLKSCLYVLLMITGNGLGGILIPLIQKFSGD